MSTSGKGPHASRVKGGSDRRSDAERVLLVEWADGIVCAGAGCARSGLAEPCAPTWLGTGKGDGGGAEGVGPSYRE
jgi:hypothetical protein